MPAVPHLGRNPDLGAAPRLLFPRWKSLERLARSAASASYLGVSEVAPEGFGAEGGAKARSERCAD